MCYPYVQERNMWSHRILYSLEYRIIPNLCLLSNFIPIKQISVIHLKVTHTSPPHLQINSLRIFISRYSSTSHLNHWWQCYLNQTSTFSWKTRESSLVLKFKPFSGKLLRNANSEIKPLINGASSNRFIIAIISPNLYGCPHAMYVMRPSVSSQLSFSLRRVSNFFVNLNFCFVKSTPFSWTWFSFS